MRFEEFTTVQRSRVPFSFCRVILIPLFIAAFLPFSGSAQQPSEASQSAPIQTAARARVPGAPPTQSPAGPTSSSQPVVVFEDGQLSINASNASIADVLFALRAATGADIDVPVNAYSEPVTAQLGPGPARKVLADLLGWSSFDYIIEGSDEDPLAVHSVTLMVRSKSGIAGATAPITAGHSSGVRPGMPASARPQTDAATAPEPRELTTAADAHSDPPSSASDNSTPPPSSQRPPVQPVSPSAASSSGARSPSDMIQELQQMYQQRRAMQEQGNQTGPPRSSP